MRRWIRWLLFRDLEGLPANTLKQLILNAAVYPSKRIGMTRQYVGVACWYFCLIGSLIQAIQFMDDTNDSPLSWVLVFLVPITATVLIVLINNWTLRRRIDRMIHERWTNGRPPNCLSCDYDLRGTAGPTCPECGERIPHADEIVRS